MSKPKTTQQAMPYWIDYGRLPVFDLREKTECYTRALINMKKYVASTIAIHHIVIFYVNVSI